MAAARAFACTLSIALTLAAGCSLRSLEPLLCPPGDPSCQADAGAGTQDGAPFGPDAASEGDASEGDASAPTETGIELYHRSDNPDQLMDKQIRLTFVLRNRAREAVPLSELTVRYYFSTESGGEQEFSCSSVSAGSFSCSDVSARNDVVPGSEANRLIEWSFAESAGLLAGDGSYSGELKGLIRNLDFSELDQSNDYSFAPHGELTLHTRMTVHQKGELVWGVPP